MIGLHIRATGLQSGMPHRGNQGEGKNPLVDPTIIISSEPAILRINCRGLFNRANAGNEGTNWLNYKYERTYKKAIKRAKRTAWQTYCSDI